MENQSIRIRLKAFDYRLIDAAKQALDKYGFGLASVRFICGTQDIHKELEYKILGKIFFNSIV